MNHDDVAGQLDAWMTRQDRAAPPALLRRTMAAVETTGQQRIGWLTRPATSSLMGAAVAMTAIVSVAVVTVVFITRMSPIVPAAGDDSSSLIESVDSKLEHDLTDALPWAFEGERLRTMSFGKVAAMEAWIQDVGRRADAEPLAYVVAYAEGAGAVRYADENRYLWGGWETGGNHPLRIHAIAFDVADSAELLAGFKASYRAEAIGEVRDPDEFDVGCRSRTVDDKEIAWCFQRVWGEWSNWYGYADDSTLYLIEGVGDIGGGAPGTRARLEKILAQLP